MICNYDTLSGINHEWSADKVTCSVDLRLLLLLLLSLLLLLLLFHLVVPTDAAVTVDSVVHVVDAC